MVLHRSQLPHYQFSPSGYQALLDEQAALLKQRPQAVEDLSRARDMGDLSENGYYKAARQKLSALDSRLKRLALLIKYAVVITSDKATEIQFGSKVRISDGKQERIFELVGNLESNPVKGKLSVDSPIGKALLGKKVGEKVPVSVPAGWVEYTVLGIE